MKKNSFLFVLCFAMSKLGHTQMVLSGDATGSCDCYTLTTTTYNAGSIWSPTTIDLTNSFDFSFEVNLGSNDGGGADGIVFVLRKDGTSTGGEGSLLGYTGITNSVGIEIDTWASGLDVAPGDIADDHVGMSADGAVDHGLVGAVAIDNIEDGEFHIFNAVWDPILMELTISIDGTELFTYTGDIVTDYFDGDPNVYFGWTGATGGSFNVQQVCLIREPNFTWEPEEPCPGEEISFTDESITGLIYNDVGITEWSWDFDGDDESDLENPIYAFETIGTKDVILTVTDISGCSSEIELTFNVRNLEPDILTHSDVSCFGDSDGTATVTIEPEEDEYTYEWDDPMEQTTETAIELAPGTYTVTVTNDVGCTGEATIIIGEPDPLEFTDILIENSSCDINDGTVTVIAEGGTPPYEYSFDGGPFTTDNEFDEIGGGTFTITIRDDNGCESEETITVESSGLYLDFIFNSPSCHGYSDGSITILTEGGGDGLTFEIKDSEDNLLNEDNSNTANTLTSGWYFFYVEDEVGCFQSDSIFLDEPDELAIDITLENPLCFGFETGWARVDEVFNFTGEYDNISYIWNPNPADIGGVFADSSYNMGAGDYTLTINDENGCSKVFDFEITEPDSMYFSEFGFDPAYCRLHEYQKGNGVVYGAASGGTPDFDYVWTNLDTEVTWTNSTWGGLNPGNYQLQVIDENGCVLTKTLYLDSLNPIADFTVTSDQLNADLKGTAPVEALFTNTSQHFANPNNPLADTTFFWNLDNPNTDWILTHDYFELFDTTYEAKGQTYEVNVCLVAINSNGCSDTACKIITVFEPQVFVPINVFTPNGDGINDQFTFEYRAASVSNFSCTIVNRWGVIVHEMANISDAWDGKDRNGSECKSGTYFYVYQYSTDNGNQKQGQGTVTLVTGE